jgi:hypothetical protein
MGKTCGQCIGYFKNTEDLCYLAEIEEVNSKTKACERFRQNCDCEKEYCPSATNGDYSPSNPWDAPGMSMRDFF